MSAHAPFPNIAKAIPIILAVNVPPNVEKKNFLNIIFLET